MITRKINMVTTQDYLLFTNTNSWMYEIKTEDVYEDFSKDKEILDFSHYFEESKYYDDSNKLVVGKMEDETCGVVVEEFVLRPKMHSFLVHDNIEHKKAKGVNKNVIEKITHSEYKDVLLNKKCLRHSMNKIQSENHKIGTYEIEINKISFTLREENVCGKNFCGSALSQNFCILREKTFAVLRN